MPYYFFPIRGKWYKANLHCHSTVSDGKLTPEQLKNAYKEKGYSVLAITDHQAIFSHHDLDDKNFLTIVGYEMEINQMLPQKYGWNPTRNCHLCLYAKDLENTRQVCYEKDYQHPKFGWCKNEELRNKRQFAGEPLTPVYEPECINKIIKTANEYGFLVTLNHPQWSQETVEQLLQYNGMFALEIYNHSSYVSGIDEENGYVYDMLLRHGHKIHCVAADDNHNFRPFNEPKSDSFGGFTMIKADYLDYDHIISALENGEYYSSQGPEIKELYYENGMIHITTSNVREIKFLTDNHYCGSVIARENEFVNKGEFSARDIKKYFRMVIIDSNGKRAYSNAYFTEDFMGDI